MTTGFHDHTCPVCSSIWTHSDACVIDATDELFCPQCEFAERREEDLVRDDQALAMDQDTDEWERGVGLYKEVK